MYTASASSTALIASLASMRSGWHYQAPTNMDTSGHPGGARAASHHQPWRRAQRSSRPEIASITTSTITSWVQWVVALTMTFMP